jgi:glycosyltransferase involved in cell wall biosynthesis
VAQRAAICVLPSADRAAVFAEQTGAAARVVWNCPSQTEVGTGKSAGEASRLTILYQGSIVRERLPLEVVDALAQAPAGVCLRIFGYEPNPDDPHVPKMLERARALGIAERIDYRGAFSRSDLLPKTAEGDIGLSLMPMTSNDVNMRHMAGASNKPFEYLSQGLPLIVPDLKEWRETFVDRGLAVACDPRDAGSIAAAIRWYWEHRAEMVEMGERGRRQVAQAWNYESQFAPVVEELEKGLEGAGAPAGRAAVDRHA